MKRYKITYMKNPNDTSSYFEDYVEADYYMLEADRVVTFWVVREDGPNYSIRIKTYFYPILIEGVGNANL